MDLVNMLIEDVPSRSTIADMTISYEVQGIINSRYQDPSLCLASIAGELQRSASYISRVFKAQTGRSLVDYINEIRIAKAKELLRRRPNEPQESIAEQVGISNIRTFQRLFKKIEGITPGRYRETYEPGTLTAGTQNSSSFTPDKSQHKRQAETEPGCVRSDRIIGTHVEAAGVPGTSKAK